MEKVCRGVHAAHTNVPPIIHRDLKPGNILLEGDEPRVSDFGLARTVVTDVDRQTPDEGGSGTPHYMSPEQYRGEAKNVLATSDVWASASSCYELFTGRRPFVGKTHAGDQAGCSRCRSLTAPRALNIASTSMSTPSS